MSLVKLDEKSNGSNFKIEKQPKTQKFSFSPEVPFETGTFGRRKNPCYISKFAEFHRVNFQLESY